ncbi:hypothetical protein ACRYCC_31845 [Actinomadura scrupuli]|uniref:hypothetical protein n=1 Tax=Actinomadura scrupuli TaxID=559629 RepID=UPI003D993B44
MKRRLPWVGLTLITAAVGLGLWPVHSEELDCGSVLRPTDFSDRSVELTQAKDFLDPEVPHAMCASARTPLRYSAAVLGVCGLTALIAGGVARRRATGPAGGPEQDGPGA